MIYVGVKDDDIPNDPDFGQKFIGVQAGGSLEIHGKDKKSWSVLTKTVVPHPHSYILDEQPIGSGVLVYEFDRATGELLYESGLMRRVKAKFWSDVLGSLQESSVIVMVSR